MRTNGSTERPERDGKDTDGFVTSSSEALLEPLDIKTKSAQLTLQLIHPTVTVSIRCRGEVRRGRFCKP